MTLITGILWVRWCKKKYLKISILQIIDSPIIVVSGWLLTPKWSKMEEVVGYVVGIES
jgi:hypothetical protein